MKPLVYIAGPYTNPDPVANTHKAIEVGLILHDSGLAAVEIPHLTLAAHLIFPRTIGFWYQFDLDKLAHCDAVWRMEGASTGADAEVKFAFARKIPIFYQEDSEWHELLEFCRGWKP